MTKEHKPLDKIEPEKAVLVGLITPTQNETMLTEYLDELEFLAMTAGAWAVGAVMTPNGPRALGMDDARAVMADERGLVLDLLPIGADALDQRGDLPLHVRFVHAEALLRKI